MIGRAGFGAQFLAASDPDDIAILIAIGEAARAERELEAREAANYIADGTRRVLGG